MNDEHKTGFISLRDGVSWKDVVKHDAEINLTNISDAMKRLGLEMADFHVPAACLYLAALEIIRELLETE